MACRSVLFTCLTIALATVMICHVSRERSTVPATSLALANRILIRGTLFVVRETRLAPEMSITLGAGNSDGGDGVRGARHTIATCKVAAVGGFTRARFVTCITHKPLRPRARYIHDHVVVLFDIIVEQINSFRGVDLPFDNYVFTRQASIEGYFIFSKMFLEFQKFMNSSAYGQNYTGLIEQLLYYGKYLITSTVCYILRVIFCFRYRYYYCVGQTIF